MTACTTCGREIAKPKRPGARGICATCRKREWEKKTSIRFADLAKLTDAEIFALCRRARERYSATAALNTLRDLVASPQSADPPSHQTSIREQKPDEGL